MFMSSNGEASIRKDFAPYSTNTVGLPVHKQMFAECEVLKEFWHFQK